MSPFRFIPVPYARRRHYATKMRQASTSWQEAVAAVNTSRASSSTTPPLEAYLTAINACARAREWQQALSLLEKGIPVQHRCNPRIMTAGIIACGKGSQWERALQLLARIEHPSIVAYNAAMHACAQKGQWRQALDVLATLCRSPTAQPTVVSFNAVLNACAKAKEWQLALHVLYTMPVTPDVISYSAALSALDKGKAPWQFALRLLDQARHCVDATCFNAALSALAQHGKWECALCILHSMPDATVISHNAVLHAMANDAKWEQALRLVSSMRRPSVISYSTAISACEKAGMWQAAWALLHRIPAAERDSRAYNACIRACEKGKQWTRALTLLGEMGSLADVASYNAAISACEKSHLWEHAVRLFESMAMPPDAISYSATLSALAHNGAATWRYALALFSRMKIRNVIAATCTITTLAQARQWQEALAILDSVETQCGVEDGTLDAMIYNACIQACSNAQMYATSVDVLHRMHTRGGIMPTVASFNSALNSATLPSHTVQLLTMMRTLHVAPNAISYSGMLHACSLSCTEDEAERASAKLIVDSAERDAVAWATHEAGEESEFVRHPHDAVELVVALARSYARVPGCTERTLPAMLTNKVREAVLDRAVNALRIGDVEDLVRFGVTNLGPFTRDALHMLGLSGEFDHHYAASQVALTEVHQRRASQDVRARDVVAHVRYYPSRTRDADNGDARPLERLVAHGGTVLTGSATSNAPGDLLPPIFVHHDRTPHAERHALTQLLADTLLDNSVVELYVSHRPCISCIHCMVAFKKLRPTVKLKVAFGNLDD